MLNNWKGRFCLVMQEFMGRNLLAMNVMWKYMEQVIFSFQFVNIRSHYYCLTKCGLCWNGPIILKLWCLKSYSKESFVSDILSKNLSRMPSAIALFAFSRFSISFPEHKSCLSPSKIKIWKYFQTLFDCFCATIKKSISSKILTKNILIQILL